MIGSLRGIVTHSFTDYCLIDVHGVGYRVFVGGSTRSRLHVGEEAMLFTHTAVREDAILLYGFATLQEYDLFQLLIGVSGIGPKVALGILSAMSVDQLCKAISQKQAGVLTKLPGIGKKSADRLILELKDKISMPGNGDEQEEYFNIPDEPMDNSAQSEAAAALMSMGYTQAELTPILKKTTNFKTTEEILSFALKELGSRFK